MGAEDGAEKWCIFQRVIIKVLHYMTEPCFFKKQVIEKVHGASRSLNFGFGTQPDICLHPASSGIQLSLHHCNVSGSPILTPYHEFSQNPNLHINVRS